MTTMEIINQLNSLIDDRMSFLNTEEDAGNDVYRNDITALSAAIEAIGTANSGKLYTAFEIIRLVQDVVSDEICGLSEEEVATAYEIERSIIAELVKEGEHETNV
jgi:hypothetical protein